MISVILNYLIVAKLCFTRNSVTLLSSTNPPVGSAHYMRRFYIAIFHVEFMTVTLFFLKWCYCMGILEEKLMTRKFWFDLIADHLMKFALLHSNLNYLFFFVDNNSLTIKRDVSKRRINIYFLLFVCWFFLQTVQAKR